MEYGYWNHEQRSTAPLAIDVIAIDCNDGWGNILRVINQSNASSIVIRIVMLTPTFDNIDLYEPGDTIPGVVPLWCQTGRANLNHIRLNFLQYQLTQQESVSVEIRHYARIPTINGSYLRQGESARYFITECYCTEGPNREYRFGDNRFWIITEDARGTLLDQIAAFRGRFDLLWNEGTVAFRGTLPVRV